MALFENLTVGKLVAGNDAVTINGATGTITVGSNGTVTLVDTATSTVYKLVVTNGVLSLVEA